MARASRRRRVSQPSYTWPLSPNVCGWNSAGPGLTRLSAGRRTRRCRRPRRRRAPARRGRAATGSPSRAPAPGTRPRGHRRRPPRVPRSQVCGPRPRSVRPAYGVTGWRWCSVAGSTANVRRRGERDQVGVGADLRCGPCGAARPAPPGAAAIQADHVGQRVAPRGRGGGPHQRQAQLQRGDPAPGRAEVAGVEALQLRRARRVVGHHAVDRAVGQPAATARPGWPRPGSAGST